MKKQTVEYELQGNYGHGWERLVTEETFAEAKQRRTEYQVNEGPFYGSRYRIVRRKVEQQASEV